MCNVPRVGVFHPGTQHSWQTARALQEVGFLRWYATSIFYKDSEFPYYIHKFMPSPFAERVERELKRFYFSKLDGSLVRTSGTYEWLERLAARGGYRTLASYLNSRGNRYFSKYINKLKRWEECNILWGFDSSSSDVFNKGGHEKRVLDKTIGDPRFYNELMRSIFSEFKMYFGSNNFIISQEKIDIIQQEYELSDVVLCGSDFCANTIKGNVGETVRSKLRVLEYCFDSEIFPINKIPREYISSNPVNFLFLGQAGPRKGIHLVLECFRKIPKSAATLTIVGELQIPPDIFAPHQDRVTSIPTVPRREVAQLMSRADCLLFPSYFEGAAITLYEAMAQNLGIIQSKNTGIVIDPGSKLLLQDLSVESLYSAVMSVIEDRSLLQHDPAHRENILANHTFDAYRSRVERQCIELLD